MKKALKIALAVAIPVGCLVAGFCLGSGGLSGMMPPVDPILPQDTAAYGPQERAALEASEAFWTAMEAADEAGMRAVADPGCTFVHIGMTCKLDEEIGFYTGGIFQPTKLDFHGKSVELFGDTAIVITDCNYALQLGGMSTEHHFAVTEVYTLQEGQWKLIQFSFTALSA